MLPVYFLHGFCTKPLPNSPYSVSKLISCILYNEHGVITIEINDAAKNLQVYPKRTRCKAVKMYFLPRLDRFRREQIYVYYKIHFTIMFPVEMRRLIQFNLHWWNMRNSNRYMKSNYIECWWGRKCSTKITWHVSLNSGAFSATYIKKISNLFFFRWNIRPAIQSVIRYCDR